MKTEMVSYCFIHEIYILFYENNRYLFFNCLRGLVIFTGSLFFFDKFCKCIDLRLKEEKND